LNSIAISISVGLAATVASLIPAIAAAWFLERSQSRLRTAVHVIVMLPLVLPPVVVGYGLLKLFSPRGHLGALLEQIGAPIAFHWAGAVVAASVVGFPLFVFSIALSIRAIDRRIERMSRTLGASAWSTFCRITLPLAWPGILSGAVLSFARGLGEFGATIILAGRIPGETETIPLAIYAELDSPSGEARIAALVLASFVICLVSILASRFLDQWQKRRLELKG